MLDWRGRAWSVAGGVSLAAVVAVVLAACGDARRLWERQRGADNPVELPVLLTTDLPFRYPLDLYHQQIQDNVTLRLFIDSLGSVVPESTLVEEPAAYAAFDSAVLKDVSRLIFRPARRGQHRIGYTVLFPIKFRVPGAPPLPDDTIREKQ